MNWIGIITKLLTAVNLLVCIFIVLLVLLQRPKNEGLGAAFGGDTASNLFGAQTTNVLATLTRWLGGIFLGLCLVIAVLGTHDSARKALVDSFIKKQAAEQAERDRQKAAEDAAKAAAAAVEAQKNPPPSATTPPVKVPDEGAPAPQPEKMTPSATPAGDAPKPAADKPAKPKAETPAPATPKPVEPKAETKPEPAKPADKPADSKAADSKPADKPAEAPAAPKPAGN